MGFWSKLLGLSGSKPADQEIAEVTAPQATAATLSTPERRFSERCRVLALENPQVERAELTDSDGPLLLVWMRGRSEPMQLYLRNTFLETRDLDPEAKAAAIERLLSITEISERETSWEEAEASLVPLLRMASFAGFASTLVWRPLAPFLRTFAGIDHESTIAYVTTDKLHSWRRDAAEVFAHAFANLTAHIDAAGKDDPDVELYDASAPYPIWHVTRNDSYEASRLAIPGFLADFRQRVSGTPIAVVPHRALMVISGDGDAAAVARLAQMAEAEFAAAPRPISPAVYSVDAGGNVVPLHLPETHPEHALVERGHRILAAASYGDQKEMLDKRHEEDGTDVFVATYAVFSDKRSGILRSWSTMAEGVATLLPHTDLIAIATEGDKPSFIPWHKMLELAPHCFERAAEHDPPRLRVVDWPSPELLAELAKHSLV